MTEKKGRGFAGMDQAKQRAIASKGGRAAHQKGTAHEFTSEEARVAGRKGGQAAHQKGTAHEFTPEEARKAGRKGGQAAHSIPGYEAYVTTDQPMEHRGDDSHAPVFSPHDLRAPLSGSNLPEHSTASVHNQLPAI
jgi:general stress protein YciG